MSLTNQKSVRKMNRNILIAIMIVIIIAAVGAFVFSQPQSTGDKVNTQLNFLSQTTLQNGDQVEFQLQDATGNAVAGQNVSIVYDDGSGDVQKYTITTDENGKGYLTINNEAAGNYDITLNYTGNNKYNGCSAKETITIEDGTSESASDVTTESSASTSMYHDESTPDYTSHYSNSSQTSSSNSSSKSPKLHYDSEYNYYYDDNGIIHGGQSDGMYAKDIREAYESGNMIDEDGNLQ
jgi:nitrogen fixation protein FixH